MKKRIAIIADIPNWSFDIIAQLLKKELSDKYEIEIFYCVTDFEKNLFKILEATKEFDVIHFLTRKLLMQFEDEEFKKCVEEKGYSYEKYVKENVKKITTCVYDHLAINDEKIDYRKIYNLYCNEYLVCSKKLYEIYTNLEDCKKPFLEIRDTIDTNLFVPEKIERFNKENIQKRPLVIGWVGNSKWNKKTENDVDYKGLKTILEVTVQELRQEGTEIKTLYADVNEKYRTPAEMQKYYSEIDIYVCSALIEGTPRPLLEAMSCGVPIITTDVGVACEVLGEKQKQFIIQERSVKKLKEKIQYLNNHREKLKELSDENIVEGIKNSTKETKDDYIKLFNKIINEQ